MIQPQHIDSSQQQPILPSDFQNANAIIQSISTPKDSQPTKLKVKNFKNRVFHLLKIYTSHSSNVNPIIQCLKQQMFFNEPQKMKQLIQSILNKQNVTLQNLQQLLQYYKVILLYKSDQKLNDSIAPQFLKLLKKISSFEKQIAENSLISMLKSFAYERKCRLNINFFFYFFRKYEHCQQIKKVFIQKCQQFIQDQKLRNAQKKQVNKILHRIDKSLKPIKVKKQQAIQNQQDDDIKVTNKKKSNLTKVQKKEQQEKEENKIEQEGQEKEKKKKQVTIGQQQKLQRIKENKKNKRKQNNQQNKNQNNNKKNENNNKSNQGSHLNNKKQNGVDNKKINNFKHKSKNFKSKQKPNKKPQ